MSILEDKRLVPKKSADNIYTIYNIQYTIDATTGMYYLLDWILDSGLDWTLDSGLDSGLDSKVL